jgi:hypothetical protein
VQHNSDATTHLTIGIDNRIDNCIDNRIDNRIDDRDLIASPWAAVVGSSLHRRRIVADRRRIVADR